MSESMEENIHIDCDSCDRAYPLKLLNRFPISGGNIVVLICDDCLERVKSQKNALTLEDI